MRYCILIFTALLFGVLLSAAEICGRCTRVSDGDTITVQEADGTKFKIRLCAIDAPEKAQPFGMEAKEKLTSLLLNRDVVVIFHAVDRYGRILGTVTVAGTDIAKAMLRGGFAWHYAYFNDDPDNAALQEEAKAAKRGLWGQDAPVPPWEYRQIQKMRSKE